MLRGIGNIASMIRQAQNLGTQMPAITEKLRGQRVTGSAGGDMVRVTADGLGMVLKIEIDDVLKQKNEWEMVENLLPAAINDAMGKAKALHMAAMQELTGDLPLPGLDDMLKQLTGSNDSDPTDDGASDDASADGGTSSGPENANS